MVSSAKSSPARTHGLPGSWANIPAAAVAAFDPYLVWAAATNFRDFALRDLGETVAVAVECRGSVSRLLDDIRKNGLDWIGVPALYRDRVALDASKIRFCSVRIPARRIGELRNWVERMELGTALTASGSPPPRDGGSNSAAKRPDWKPRTVIGIIDDFVAFASPIFADASGNSTVRYVWSQAPVVPECTDRARWRSVSDSVGYGFELCSLGAPTRRKSRDEAPSDARLSDAYPRVLARATHGTSVADLATRRCRATPPPGVDSAELIAVHFPQRMLDDASGGALCVQALDGLHYIVERAGEQANVVVNMSYATMAGPHDGSSILEQAIDELIAARKNRLAVVLPAGNAYEARCHARFRLDRSRPRQTLQWKVLPDDLTASFLEIWLPQSLAAHVAIEVTDPLGRRLQLQAGVGDETFSAPAALAGVDCAIVRRSSKVGAGSPSTFVLIAMAATASRSVDAVLAPHGLWNIELRLRGRPAKQDVEQDIHAWIERDDSAHGRPRTGRQSILVDEAYAPFGETPVQPVDTAAAVVKRAGSFNTIAAGERSFVVGGLIGCTGQEAAYSGRGPTRSPTRRGPTSFEVSEDSPTLHGVRTAAVGERDTVRVNGTSVAAPQLTARIAQWLMSGTIPDLSFAEVSAKIRATGLASPGSAVGSSRIT